MDVRKLQLSFESGTPEVRLRSGLLLSEIFAGRDDFRRAADICIELLGEGYEEPALLKNALGALNSLELYEELNRVGDRYDDINSGEILLLRLRGLIKTGSGKSLSMYRSLLCNYLASDYTADAVEAAAGTVPADSEVKLLEKMKMELLKSQYRAAGSTSVELAAEIRDSIEELLKKEYIYTDSIMTDVVLTEVRRAASSSGRSGDLLTVFEEIIALPEKYGFEKGEVYPHSFTAGLYETAGYLERSFGKYRDASEKFITGLEYASGDLYEKMLWYWYSSLVKYSPLRACSETGKLTELWTNPAYYSDVFLELAGIIVRNGWWSRFPELLKVLENTGPAETVSMFAYLTARAGMEGYLEISADRERALFELSFKNGYGVASGLYYRLMSGVFLREMDPSGERFSSGDLLSSGPVWSYPEGKIPLEIFNIKPAEKLSPSEEGAPGARALIGGFIEYGLFAEAYSYLMSKPFDDPGLVRLFAQKLKESGKYTESVRLLGKFIYTEGFGLTFPDLLILYPEAFKELTEPAADRYNLEPSVFTALIREESHFQADVVSSAGAVGLCQIMPSTGEDIAGRLRVSRYDLRDPETNINFGSWYLNNLLSRTEAVSHALFAYNGGLTRVRRWLEQYSSLPDDLFLEAVPYRETSHYVRKILVSSAVYGYLYGDMDSVRIVSLFYRNIK